MTNNTMIAFAVCCISIAPFGVRNATAGTVTATFDDITEGTFAAVPDGYRTLNWENLFVINQNYSVVSTSGYQNGLISGEYTAFNGVGTPAKITHSAGLPFVVNSVFLTSAWNTGLHITIDGFLNNAQVASQTVIVDTTQATFIEFDFGLIDTLKLTSFGGELREDLPVLPTSTISTQFAMDNLSLSVVPLPPALLAGLGMFGVAGISRGVRRRRSNIR